MTIEDNRVGARDRRTSTADVDALWTLPGEREGETLFAETWRRAQSLARQLEARDVQNAAGEALVHLMRRVREAPEQFQLEDGWDLNGFRPWARVVLRNHLVSQVRRLEAGRHVLSGDERVVSAMHRGPGALEAAGPDTPQASVREWEGAVLLLLAVLALPPARRDLVLGAMAGFSSRQLRPHVGYACGSARVVLTQSRASVRAWLQEERGRGQERLRTPAFASGDRLPADRSAALDRLTPDGDLPLVDRETRRLEHALRYQADAPGDRLLEAMYTLEALLRLTFVCRLAGFWDGVIAPCQSRSLLDVRQSIRAAARAIEQHLSNDTSGMWMDPTDPSARDVSSPDRSTTDEAIMGRADPLDPQDAPADAGQDELSREDAPDERLEAAGAARWDGLSSDDLFRLIEHAPEAAVTLMLDVPVVQRALARGRADCGLPAVDARRTHALLAEASQQLEPMPAPPATRAIEPTPAPPATRAIDAVPSSGEVPSGPDLVSALLKQAKQWLEGAGQWLTLPPAAAVPMRSGHTGSSTPAPLIATLGPTPDAHLEHHCLVWQVEGSRLRLAYPRLPGDPTRGEALAGRRVVLRPASDAPLRCLVAWIEEPVPPALTSPSPNRPALLQTWLEAQLEAGVLEGVHLYRIEVPTATREAAR